MNLPLLLMIIASEVPAPPARAPVVTVTVGQVYEAPAAVRPMNLRYTSCLTNAFSSALRAFGRPQTPAELRAIPGQAIEACAAIRKEAAAQADAILSGEMGKRKRAAIIEAMLGSVERNLQANAESMASYSEAAASAARRRNTLVSQVPLGSFRIPDELGPALAPYMNCRFASLGVPVYAAGKEKPIPPPRGIGKGSDCTLVRTKAAKDADRMLEGSNRGSRAERAALIERVLVSIDEFNPGPPLPPPVPKD